MARSRNLKPAFFLDDQLAELRFEVRLLCAGLPTLADREGRLEDRPKMIKAQLFAYDNVNVDKALADLAGIGRIVRYEIGGVRYIYISNFLRDQNPHVREPASTIPPPPSTGSAPGEAPTKHQSSTGPASAKPEPARLIPDSSFLIPDSPSLSPSQAEANGATHASPDEKREREFLEALHNNGLKVPAGNGTVRAWLASHPDDLLAAAVKRAVAKKNGSPLNLGYIGSILADQSWQGAVSQAAAREELGIPEDWDASDDGVMTALRALGMGGLGSSLSTPECKHRVRLEIAARRAAQ